MIKINELKKTYGSNTVLDIPSLEIYEGEVIGLVGNNGAGKTTLISLILDLIQANSGNVLSKDVDVSKSEDWKAHTGAFLSDSFLIDFLTPEEYFDFVGTLHQWNTADLNPFLDGFSDFFNGEILGSNKYIRDLSKGNQKKVGIAAALIGNPDVVLLDEPFANLDPSTQNRLNNIIKDLDHQGKTLMISSHDLNHISNVCTRIVVLDKGQVVYDLKNTEEALATLKSHFEA